MSAAAKEMEQANLDTTMIMFSMWTESIKQFGETSKGNVIFLDGSPDGMQHTMKQMMGMMQTRPDVIKQT
ncbi:MAG: band 7 protein [Bacteroidota bacterium]|nr:band 7 protein [Bacteroidota bacterium]